MQGISLVAEDLLASQKELCSLEFSLVLLVGVNCYFKVDWLGIQMLKTPFKCHPYLVN
jgi:hypothetical protein